MKYVIDDVLTSYTKRIYSHRSSWPRTQRCMMLDNGMQAELAFGDLELIAEADVWVISHGMEFKEAYNLNGGWLPEHAERLRLMIDKQFDQIVSLERSMPDLVGLLRPRAEKTEFDLTESEWQEVKKIQDNALVMEHSDLVPNPRRVVLGDSHSVGRYQNDTRVLRFDGLTLHGLLNRGIEETLDEFGLDPIEKLVIQAGNIDIRHHLARQPDVYVAIDELMIRLESQISPLLKYGRVLEVEMTDPYPIEFEGRKLPKTGYYKGAPFFGDWKTRNHIRELFSSKLHTYFDNVKKWPSEWYRMDPEEYANTYMEKPRSVHLSPEFYEWDLERNVASVWKNN
jgi:hypothetical protein